MSDLIKIKIPDIGDFSEVEVIELLVQEGDSIEKEQSLITLESDKASMEIPSPQSGVVKKIAVRIGDKVSEGDTILWLQPVAEESTKSQPPVFAAEAPVGSMSGLADIRCQLLVLGAGPGGYTAAFRAADLGLKTVLVEKYADLGGVCLNVGCIPSKALLHTTELIHAASELKSMGVYFEPPRIDLDQLRASKDRVVKKLTQGLMSMAKMRKVQVVQGWGQFSSPKSMQVESDKGRIQIEFDYCIIACGSSSVQIPSFPHQDPRLIDSTGALALQDIPQTMLIIGGGIIGLEMATVYAGLGSTIDLVELQDGLVPGCDRDLVRVLHKKMQSKLRDLWLSTRVEQIESLQQGLEVHFSNQQKRIYDKVLLAIGRRPNGHSIGADKAGVHVDERGFIPVNEKMQTNVPHILAIGDVVGQPMLAHKATHEGKVAAEVIAGKKGVQFDAMTIPAVAYTDPEIAWMGLTETDAQAKQIPYRKAIFPWSASGRAIGIGREEGLTKLIYDPDSQRILGAGIVGANAGELISETVLALEMGADMEDIALTIHPHPTLSESVGMAAEVAEGSCTDLPPKQR